MSDQRYCGCPYCEAIFRLPDNKYKRRSGVVRCGACREIFDSSMNLVVRSGDEFVPVTVVSAEMEPSTVGPVVDVDAQKDDVGLVDGEGRATSSPDIDSLHSASLDDDLAVTYIPDPDLEFSGPSYDWKKDENEEVVKDIYIDDVKNPFDDDPDPSQKKEPVKEARTAPAFSPLDLDEKLKKDESGSSETSETSKGEIEHSDLKDVLFPESENYVDEFDSELNINLITAGVIRDQDAGLSEDSFIDNSNLDETQPSSLSRKSVDKYITDRKNPFSSLAWLAVTAVFVVLLGAQVKYFFVEKYAQDESLRPYLLAFCGIANCSLAPRKDPFKFTLTHTKIDLHPAQPGAIRVTVKLINEAGFAQPFPHLQLTLTDRVGRVVGRRTFSPELYMVQNPEKLLGRGELASILFDLARPHEKAVGFVVDIVTKS